MEEKDKRTEIEKERKFLLKNMPEISLRPDGHLTIIQFYKDGWRYRSEYDGKETKYYKLKKVKLDKGINKEVDIEEIDMITFFNLRTGTTAERHEIHKMRYIFNYEGRKFEVDQFKNLTLVMVEIEGVTMEDEIKFPPEISAVMIMEVTGNEAFDNFRLGS